MKLKSTQFLKLFKFSPPKEAKSKAAIAQDLRNLYSMNRNKLNFTVSE